MVERPQSCGEIGWLDAAARTAGAGRAVADDPQAIDRQGLKVVAEPDGPDLDVMGHE